MFAFAIEQINLKKIVLELFKMLRKAVPYPR